MRRENWPDLAILAGLFFGYLAWLLGTTGDLGYSRDEGFYFHAARTYGKWFELLLSDPARALRASEVDQHWRENSEHPALMKSLFWLSNRLFHRTWFSESGTAHRFPAMLLAAALVCAVFSWGRRTYGRAGGVVAALAFALMPRVFYHSHLSCFDVPITALWFFTAYAYQRSLEPRRFGWALASAVLFGLALNTKHNAWLLPPVIVAHALARHLLGLIERRSLRGWYRIRVPLSPVLMLFIGPAVFYAGWPWIWRDTFERLQAYVKFHTQHVYYNMEFLGRTYFEPPFPRSYAWLMTLGTVPAITLALAGLGALVAGVCGLRSLRERRPRASAAGEGGQHVNSDAGAAARSAPELFWALAVLVSYAPWWLTTTPIFGGTKHWLTAYPFMALFAGRGFVWLCDVLRSELDVARRSPRLASLMLGTCALLGPLAMTWHSHPWGLSAYTPLVGGAPGAASLGLNRTFWGYTTGALLQPINDAGPNQRLYVHDTAMDSFRMLQKDRRLRRDLKPWWTVAGSTLALYHHEQHMSRVEHMIWVDYGTAAPAYIGAFDGVPVTWLYRRP